MDLRLLIQSQQQHSLQLPGNAVQGLDCFGLMPENPRNRGTVFPASRQAHRMDARAASGQNSMAKLAPSRMINNPRLAAMRLHPNRRAHRGGSELLRIAACQ